MPIVYELKPNPVKAALVTSSNVEDLAKWCDGAVSSDQDPISGVTYWWIDFKSDGRKNRAHENYYLVQFISTGGFMVMTKREFESMYTPVIVEELPPQSENLFDLPRMPFNG